jgi:hypothetical protein
MGKHAAFKQYALIAARLLHLLQRLINREACRLLPGG